MKGEKTLGIFICFYFGLRCYGVMNHNLECTCVMEMFGTVKDSWHSQR